MNTSKAAFYVDLRHLDRPWDFSVDDQALSGTDSSLIAVTSHFLSLSKETRVFATTPPRTSHPQVVLVSGVQEAYEWAQKAKSRSFVFVARSSSVEQEQLFKSASGPGPFLFPWAQNTPSSRYLGIAYRSRARVHLICVSHGQGFHLCWHPLSRSAVVVPNFLDSNFWHPITIDGTKSTAVVYIGALKPSKGFHHLADVWSRIWRRHPTWKLLVCGGADLYGKTEAMGAQGVAESSYESLLLKPLGGSRESASAMGVNFLGSVTKEQIRNILRQASIAVVNPNTKGSLETFCVAAIEAQAMSVPVVGARAGALLETVGHEYGGLLAANRDDLVRHLSRLIEEPQLRQRLGAKGQMRVLARYAHHTILSRWERLLASPEPLTMGLGPSGTENHPPDYKIRRLLGRLPLGVVELIKSLRAHWL